MLLLFSVFLIVGCSEQSNQVQEDIIVKETIESSGVVKEFKITARQWEFEPSIIEVNKGDTVKLSVESIDVKHSFSLFQFGVNEILNPGKTVEFEFVADKTGEFSFFCSVPCGKGHGNMNGKLIVK